MRQNYFFEYVPNAYINLCVDKAQQMAIRGSSRGTRQLPHEKSLTYTAPVSHGNCLRA